MKKDCGILRIANGDDRATVAEILFRNGYAITTKKIAKTAKSTEYVVKYWKEDPLLDEDEAK